MPSEEYRLITEQAELVTVIETFTLSTVKTVDNSPPARNASRLATSDGRAVLPQPDGSYRIFQSDVTSGPYVQAWRV